jgi:hypothetical protein
MLFHTFHNQTERRDLGGSAFIEIQFCRLPERSSIKSIVDVSSIKHWQDDSLYVSDEDVFYQEYGHIFVCGTYNNLKTGPVDLNGINYYPASLTDTIIKRIRESKPADYTVLVDWLERAKAYNGFYILGI